MDTSRNRERSDLRAQRGSAERGGRSGPQTGFAPSRVGTASVPTYGLGAPIAEKKLILAWVGRARILAMRIVENDTGAKEIDAEICA